MDGTPGWLINTVGVTAGLCSMASFVPQILKILKEQNAEGVSLRMYAVTIVGFVCWTAFGMLTGSWPVAAANGVCLALTSVVLALRLHFGDGRA